MSPTALIRLAAICCGAALVWIAWSMVVGSGIAVAGTAPSPAVLAPWGLAGASAGALAMALLLKTQGSRDWLARWLAADALLALGSALFEQDLGAEWSLALAMVAAGSALVAVTALELCRVSTADEGAPANLSPLLASIALGFLGATWAGTALLQSNTGLFVAAAGALATAACAVATLARGEHENKARPGMVPLGLVGTVSGSGWRHAATLVTAFGSTALVLTLLRGFSRGIPMQPLEWPVSLGFMALGALAATGLVGGPLRGFSALALVSGALLLLSASASWAAVLWSRTSDATVHSGGGLFTSARLGGAAAAGAASLLLLATLRNAKVGMISSGAGSATQQRVPHASAETGRRAGVPQGLDLALWFAGAALGLLAVVQLRHWQAGQPATQDEPELTRAALIGGAWVAAVAAVVCAFATTSGWKWLVLPVAILGPALPLAWSTPAEHRDPTSAVWQAEGVFGIASARVGPTGLPELGFHGQPLQSGVPAALLAHRAGRISAGLRPEARRVLILGLGSADLWTGIQELLPERLECIEPSAELLTVAAALGSPAVGPIFRHAAPRVWLEEHPGSYDLIIDSPVSTPGREVASRLSMAQFLAMRRALAPSGVAVQWIELSQLTWPAFGSVADQFVEVFPDARLFLASLRADQPLVGLVGGLSAGLPDSARVDAALAARPSAVGPAGADDVQDLYVADAWTLQARLRDLLPQTFAGVRSSWPSDDTETEPSQLARINLRQLAALAVPLDTSSLAVRPLSEKENRRLGLVLRARSAALRGLLVARAARIELAVEAEAAVSPAQRDRLERELGEALLFAWHSAPGHSDVRAALIEAARDMGAAERWEVAQGLLESALQLGPDAQLMAVLCGILLKRGDLNQALRIGFEAYESAPQDSTVLLSLGGALLHAGRDEEALPMLEAAQRLLGTQPLPRLHNAALLILSGDARGGELAREILLQQPADPAWQATLRRLLGNLR